MHPTYVRFEFGDRVLEGEVVDTEPVGNVGHGPDTKLTVDVDGVTYRALASEASPA